jgi:type IV pilus biogenesis protein CpaD/CtpE
LVLQEHWRGLSAALIVLVCGGCAPDTPVQPSDSYVLAPRSFSVRLDRPAGDGSPAGIDRASLQRLLDDSRAAAAHQVSIEIDGRLTEAQRRAAAAEIRASVPQAVVTFGPGGDGPLQATVRYREVIASRCIVVDDWMEDGLMRPGCATAMATARMVADPADLVTARQMGPAALQPLARDAIHYLDQAPAGNSTGSQDPSQSAGQAAAPSTAPSASTPH